MSHYLNKCWLFHWHMYASLGLNALKKATGSGLNWTYPNTQANLSDMIKHSSLANISGRGFALGGWMKNLRWSNIRVHEFLPCPTSECWAGKPILGDQGDASEEFQSNPRILGPRLKHSSHLFLSTECPLCRRTPANVQFVQNYHDDVIKWKTFPRYWSFVRGIHRSVVNSPYKGQWCLLWSALE